MNNATKRRIPPISTKLVDPNDSSEGFSALLNYHLKEGTRPARNAVWDNPEFAKAIGTTTKNITNWRNGVLPTSFHILNEIRNKLFNNSPKHAEWNDALWNAWLRDRENQNKERSGTRRKRANAINPEIVERYEKHVCREFLEVRARLQNRTAPLFSNSRDKLLGRLHMLRLPDGDGFKVKRVLRKPQPRIAAAELKRKFREIRLALSTKTDFIHHIVSFRYILLCYSVAAGISEYNRARLFDPLVKAIEKRRPIRIDYAALEDLIEKLFTPPTNMDDVLDRCTRILTMLGELTNELSVSLDALYIEDTSPDRNAYKKQRQRDIELNVVTHVIEIYFEDKKGNYSDILHAIRVPELNFLFTQSETLTPGRVARAVLMVNHPDDATKLEDFIESLLKKSSLDSIVLKFFVNPWE